MFKLILTFSPFASSLVHQFISLLGVRGDLLFRTPAPLAFCGVD